MFKNVWDCIWEKFMKAFRFIKFKIFRRIVYLFLILAPLQKFLLEIVNFSVKGICSPLNFCTLHKWIWWGSNEINFNSLFFLLRSKFEEVFFLLFLNINSAFVFPFFCDYWKADRLIASFTATSADNATRLIEYIGTLHTPLRGSSRYFRYDAKCQLFSKTICTQSQTYRNKRQLLDLLTRHWITRRMKKKNTFCTHTSLWECEL